MGIVSGAKQPPALLSYDFKHHIVKKHPFQGHRRAETEVWFKLDSGNDTAIGRSGVRNVFEVEAGKKTFTGAEYEDTFLLMVTELQGAATYSTLDGAAGEDTIVVSHKPAEMGPYSGYKINLNKQQGQEYIDFIAASADKQQPDRRIAELRNIEHAQGHKETDDILIGDDKGNRLHGGGGTDRLTGHGGGDTLTLQAGIAQGGSGLDTYHILSSTGESEVILEDMPGESSHVFLDYNAVDLQPVIELTGNDVVLKFMNKNGSHTGVRMKNVYSIVAGTPPQKVLQHQWLFFTRDGMMFGLPGTLQKDAQGQWSAEIPLNKTHQLAVTYSPQADRDKGMQYSSSPGEVRLHQQSRNREGQSEITAFDAQNKVLYKHELPDFMKLFPQSTHFRDELEGDAQNDYLQNQGAGDTLRGGSGADVYKINERLPEGTEKGEVIIDNEDTAAHPQKDLLKLPWEVNRIKFRYDGEDLILYQQQSETARPTGLEVRLQGFLRDERYRHLSVQDGQGRLLTLTVDARRQAVLGPLVQFTDRDDHVVLHHASELATKALHAGGGDDTVFDESGGTTERNGRRGTCFYGEAGDDTLVAESGDNFFSGGTGNDFLSGGAGNDTYEFSAGDGQDTIEDSGGDDKLHFKNISKEQLSFKREKQDLVVTVRNTHDSVTIKDAFAGPAHVVETITTTEHRLNVSPLILAMSGFIPKHTTGSRPDTPHSLLSRKVDALWIADRIPDKVLCG